MFRAYRYRIYPTKQQVELLNKHFGCSRFIYNLALEARELNYLGNRKRLSDYDLIKQLTDLKKECLWLSDVSINALQQSIFDLGKAYSLFFKKQTKFPNYKNKKGAQSFRVIDKIKIDVVSGKIYIPKFREGIKIVSTRSFEGRIKSCTVSKTPTNKYFASILVENNEKLPMKPRVDRDNSIGIDLGITTFAALSNGVKIENPKYLKNDIARLKALQRRASRKMKGSQNRKKANLIIARKHEKIINRRIDFIHKLTYDLVCKNQATTICIEDLAVNNLLKNHKLAQSISDVSWSKFVNILSYKCDWYGKNLIKVDRYFASSKICSVCGLINESLTLTDRTWTCNCGATHDRDINAAINIRNSGVECSGVPVELLSIDKTVKQERINHLIDK